MKKLNQRGFAISAILYTMLVLTVLLMFLVIGILANRRATLNKLSSEAKKRMDGTNNLLYNVVKKSPATKEGTENGEDVYYYTGSVNDNYVIFAGACWRMMRTTESNGIKIIYNGGVQTNNTCADNAYFFIAEPWWGTGIDEILKTVDRWYDNGDYNVKVSQYEDSLEKMHICVDKTSDTWKKAVELSSSVDFSCSDSDTDYISLPTIYEVATAGGRYNTANSNYYLYAEGKSTGTVSAGSSNDQFAYIQTDGSIMSKNFTDGTSTPLRPVISLKKGTKYASGSGLMNDPYIVK